MEKIYKAGLAQSISISHWSIGHLENMLKYADGKPAINQVENHPFFPNSDVVEYCLSHEIPPVGYGPLGTQAAREYRSARGKALDNDDLKAIAARKGVDLGQLLISWGVLREAIQFCQILLGKSEIKAISKYFFE
jgi:diketogulonate reductase-like aldo/keto reductase